MYVRHSGFSSGKETHIFHDDKTIPLSTMKRTKNSKHPKMLEHNRDDIQSTSWREGALPMCTETYNVTWKMRFNVNVFRPAGPAPI